ncbi:MAG TPA: hypothetical protein DEF21_05155 [Thalassospira lucentensis]|uniref:Uncharacterized protein n=1 Tax=Thalassospira lucentensis TaxID=168935 RepID=A0A358HQ54_9PROT|nr:hypothetical protein [Thalassospira lucentensis]HCW67726.1 hypothetical protein [Thalassospira lucentensis]|tara:strand:- start:1124 stop:1306 length:183 start_codon:yes stop_codon:yes gene_type:complete
MKGTHFGSVIVAEHLHRSGVAMLTDIYAKSLTSRDVQEASASTAFRQKETPRRLLRGGFA